MNIVRIREALDEHTRADMYRSGDNLGYTTEWCCLWIMEKLEAAAGIAFNKWISVNSFADWAKQNGIYHNGSMCDIKPFAFVLFDWPDPDTLRPLDHIGLYLRYENGKYVCREGNTGSGTSYRTRQVMEMNRDASIIDGYVNLDDLVRVLFHVEQSTEGTTEGKTYIGQGERSKRVAAVQALMNVLLSDDEQLTIDGIYGTKTADAVEDLQRASGLETDGVIGLSTFSVMLCKAFNTLIESIEE